MVEKVELKRKSYDSLVKTSRKYNEIMSCFDLKEHEDKTHTTIKVDVDELNKIVKRELTTFTWAGGIAPKKIIYIKGKKCHPTVETEFKAR